MGCQIELSLQYLALNHSIEREDHVATDQSSLRKQASLNSFNCLSPRPPSDFGRQIVSHLTKLLLSLSKSEDQRKFLISLSIRRQVLEGRGIIKEIWIRMELRTCLISISLPVKERSLDFQPTNLVLMESIILLKKVWRALPKNR